MQGKCKSKVDTCNMNDARAYRIHLNRQMAMYNMDGATINKRVANALNEAAGKIAFKSYAADINAQGGGNDSTKTALKRLQDK